MARTGTHQIAFKNNDVNSLTLAADLSATFAGDISLTQANTPTIELKDTTNNQFLLIRHNNSASIFDVHTDSHYEFQINSSEKMRLDNSGRLGIGVTSLSSMFTLQGNETGGQTITHLHLNSGNNNSFPFLASLNNATISSATYGWTFNNSSSTVNLEIGRRNNSTTTSTVLTLERSTGNATFAGDIEINVESGSITRINF